LALQLGYTVKRLLKELTLNELLDWSTFFRMREGRNGDTPALSEDVDWSKQSREDIAEFFNIG
jgi:hypothetical protein